MTEVTNTAGPLLRVSNLQVARVGANAGECLVCGVSFHLPRDGVTAIVGESGSGKTLTALSLIGLLPESLTYRGNSAIEFDGHDLLYRNGATFDEIRGRRIAMVLQNAGACLNPCLSAITHLLEPLRAQRGLAGAAARATALDLLREVGLRDSERRADHYPHQFSGGEQQRVLIAATLACQPDLLIADEPTSALDIVVQRQIVELLLHIRLARHMSLLVITHDLGLVAQIADHLIVMHDGVICEQGPAAAVLVDPQHSYTKLLLNAGRRLHGLAEPAYGAEPTGKVVLAADRLSKSYDVRAGWLRHRKVTALHEVSFELRERDTLGVVGESGSGKTTLALALTRLVGPCDGGVCAFGTDLIQADPESLRQVRRRLQIVLQNPYNAFNPQWTIRRSLLEPMRVHGIGGTLGERTTRAAALIDRVGLPADALERRPDQFSGGQLQRLAIARCLTLDPEILICDESISSLDATVGLQILDLLRELRDERGLSYIFISHDLGAIRYFTDRLIVLQGGRVVESGATAVICDEPRHPYTRALLEAAFGSASLRAAA